MGVIRWNGEAIDGAIRSIEDAASRMNSALLTARRTRDRLTAMQGVQASKALSQLNARLEDELRRMERFMEDSAALRRALDQVSELFEEAEKANIRRCQSGMDSEVKPFGRQTCQGFGALPARAEVDRAMEALTAALAASRSSGAGLGGGFSGGAGGLGGGGGGGRSFFEMGDTWCDAPESIGGIGALSGIERVGTVPLIPSAGEIFLPSWLS